MTYWNFIYVHGCPLGWFTVDVKWKAFEISIMILTHDVFTHSTCTHFQSISVIQRNWNYSPLWIQIKQDRDIHRIPQSTPINHSESIQNSFPEFTFIYVQFHSPNILKYLKRVFYFPEPHKDTKASTPNIELPERYDYIGKAPNRYLPIFKTII